MIDIYVDDINIIVTDKELPKAIDCLKKEFDMKGEEGKSCVWNYNLSI